MAASILIEQAGKPAGVAGRAREDIDTGLAVSLTAVGGPFLQYLWTRLDAPIDHSVPAVSAAGIVAPGLISTTMQPIDNAGTYFVQLTVDNGQGLGATPEDIARITFVAGIAQGVAWNEVPLRKPAFGEKLETNAPTATALAGNPRGWANVMDHWLDVIGTTSKGTVRTWGRIQLTPGGATKVQGLNVASVLRLGVGRVQVTFLQPQSSVNYAVTGNARGSVGGSITPNTEGLSTFVVERADIAGVLVDEDFNFLVNAT